MSSTTFDTSQATAPETATAGSNDWSAQVVALQEVGNALSRAGSFDELCRLAVALGRDRLGFERLGIWWSEDDGAYVSGTFGIDEAGQVRDERGCRVPVTPESLGGQVLRSGRSLTLLDHAPIRDHRGTVVGRGMHAAAALWDGDRVVGFIAMDHHLTRRPLAPREEDLLTLFASTVGHLARLKRTEDELRRSQRELTDFIENATVGLHWVGPDGTILWANQAELDLLGYRREEYVGHHIAEFHADREAIDDILTRLLRNEVLHNYEARLRCKDGAIRHVLINSNVLWEGDSFVHTRCFTRDITDRRLAEEAIRFQAHLLDTVEQAVIATDREGRITYWNRFAETLYGWSADEVIGQNIETVTPVAPEQAGAIMAQLARGESWSGEFRVRRRDGSEFPAWVHDTPVRNECGEIVGVVGVSTDITERKWLEQALRERADELAEADHRKDEFLAMLAHELRNPLAAASNAIHILDSSLPDEARTARMHGVISRQLDRLARLVDDLLDVSRLTHGVIELREQPVRLASVVENAIETVRPLVEAKQQTLEIGAPPTSVIVRGDAARLEQVFGNLLDNASKYTPAGGRIEVRVDVDECGGTRWAVLRVRDSGVGMAPELVPRVFDLFTQAARKPDRAQGGLGIGLTITRRLVELHGGTVHAASPGEGAGSEFTVRLPALGRELEASDVLASQPAIETGPLSLLLIEDNPDVAETMEGLLSSMGHAVTVTHTGEAGIEAAHRTVPQAVLVDIGLPDIDGYEVARRLRRRGDSCPLLVALTGYGQERDRRLSAEAGFDHHLVKPVDPEDLKRLLTTAAEGVAAAR